MNFNQDNNAGPIRFTPGKDKFDTDSNDVGTRPTGDPKSSKNFQKILRKNDEKERDGDDNAEAVDADEGGQNTIGLLGDEKIPKRQAPSSLFDLSSTASKNAASLSKSDLGPLDNPRDSQFIADARNSVVVAPIDPKMHGNIESPAMLYSKMTTKEPKKTIAHIEQNVDVSQPFKVEERKDNINNRFATEQPDLSYVNPMALNTQSVQSVPFTTEKAAAPSINIQDIINQLVDKVVQLETSGRTDTVITLKHPPVLAGADLVVTGFDSAKGEFNITFQKLTQAAKELLDMRINQQSLLSALEQKGYAVHIVTTTTLAEINLPPAGSLAQDRNRNPDQGQEQGRGQHKQQQRQQK